MAARKERTTVLLTEEELSLLTKAAKAAGLSVATYLRSRGITAARAEQPQAAPAPWPNVWAKKE